MKFAALTSIERTGLHQVSWVYCASSFHGCIAGVGNLRPTSSSCAARQTCRGKKSNEALPYMSADIICLLETIRLPFLTQMFHPITPFFTTVHIQRLFFFFQNWKCKISNFLCASRAYRKLLSIFSWKWQIFTQIWPSLHQKSPEFFGSHRQWPFF